MNAFIPLALALASSQALAWSNPYSYENNPNSYYNSPYAYDNSVHNPRNTGFMHGDNDRSVYDPAGNRSGYAVPTPNGGLNFFDSFGNRTGFSSGGLKGIGE